MDVTHLRLTAVLYSQNLSVDRLPAKTGVGYIDF
jgi:hypothetical protein